MYRYLKKITFTGGNTESKWCHVRKTRRCGGAFSLLLPLIFATAMLLHTSVARAVDIFKAENAGTYYLCQQSSIGSNDVFKLWELGGSFTFTPAGSFMEGASAGAARLTGVITGGGNEFAVDILLDGRLDEGDAGYDQAKTVADFLLHEECATSDGVHLGGVPMDGWHFYTSLTGTLTGLPGLPDSIYDGAVYNLTLRDGLPQVGFGANTHNINFGAFAKINFELAKGNGDPNLPVGPFAGEMGMDITLLDLLEYFRYTVDDNFPTASPDIVGTWTGVIDCAGMLDFTDTETFSGSMKLEIGSVDGRYYGARLYAQNVLVASFCITYLNNLRGGQINTGFMFNSDDPNMSKILLKVREDASDPQNIVVTLKAREFTNMPDGLDADGWPDGLEVCKWSFTRDDIVIRDISVCPDADGDGVLDNPSGGSYFMDGFDYCNGFDDNIDVDANGVPDGCEQYVP